MNTSMLCYANRGYNAAGLPHWGGYYIISKKWCSRSLYEGAEYEIPFATVVPINLSHLEEQSAHCVTEKAY